MLIRCLNFVRREILGNRRIITEKQWLKRGKNLIICLSGVKLNGGITDGYRIKTTELHSAYRQPDLGRELFTLEWSRDDLKCRQVALKIR